MNVIPSNVKLDKEFFAFLRKMCYERFTTRAKQLVSMRRSALLESRAGLHPAYLPASRATIEDWKVDLPDWCKDQRNQMTGPADNAELVVKLLNSDSPGVMLDVEDSMCNSPDNLLLGLDNPCHLKICPQATQILSSRLSPVIQK